MASSLPRVFASWSDSGTSSTTPVSAEPSAAGPSRTERGAIRGAGRAERGPGGTRRSVERSEESTRLPIGLAVCIGLTYRTFDSDFYRDVTVPELAAPPHDVAAMKSLLERGEQEPRFAVRRLLDQDATHQEILASIRWAALGQAGVGPGLQAGDLFVLSFSGHGVALTAAGGDEPHDQAWCLYDNLLLDDELAELWPLFSPGVRVVVVSDSCHSGTMLREVSPAWLQRLRSEPDLARRLATLRPRQIPPATLSLLTRQHAAELADRRTPRAERSNQLARLSATVLLLAACQDDQLANEFPEGGAFTTALTTVCRSEPPPAGYATAVTQAAQRIELPNQTPRFERLGPTAPAFEQSAPFRL